MPDPALPPRPEEIIAELGERLAVLERRGASPGSGARSADVQAQEAVTADTYGDLATVGPSVTVTLGAGQRYLVTVSAVITGAAFMAPEISGAGVVVPSDANSAHATLDTGQQVRSSNTQVFVAGDAGERTVTAKYRTFTSFTGEVDFRRLIVTPL